MQKEEPWEMLSDNKIWAMLQDTNREIDPEYSRLLFIDLFSRLKNLEMENHTLKVLLFQYEYVEEDLYSDALKAVKEFFKEWDDKKAKEVDFYANLGISFVDWAAFVAKGKFDKQALDGQGPYPYPSS